MADVVDILLRLRGSRAFQSEADKSSKAIGRIGDEAETTGKQAKGGWKHMAKWGAPAAFFAGTAAFFKSSVSATEDLAKNTFQVARSTGLSTEAASAWGTVLKSRGTDSKAFAIGMTKLSKTMVGARDDSDKFAATFGALNIGKAAVDAGNVQSVLLQAADGFASMTDPAQKAALAQQLFGRQAQTLLPLMSQGSEGLLEQLNMARDYGAVLSDDSANGAKDLIAKQREMKIAMEGLKVTLGTALLPAILGIVGAFSDVVKVVQPILRDATVMKVLFAALTVAFIAYKVAIIASTIATLGFNTAFLLIPLAVIAVIAALVLLYKKCAWFRDAVNAIWAAIKTAFTAVVGFIKDHWKAFLIGLTGPLGAAVVLVLDNWDKIKSGVGTVIDWIMDKLRPLYDFVKKIGGGISDAVGVAKDIGGLASKIPGFASGGRMPRTGTALVGEQGPELVTLPGGSHVIPTPAIASIGAPPPLDGGGPQTIVTQVFLNRRQIAEAVGTYVADKRARR